MRSFVLLLSAQLQRRIFLPCLDISRCFAYHSAEVAEQEKALGWLGVGRLARHIEKVEEGCRCHPGTSKVNRYRRSSPALDSVTR